MFGKVNVTTDIVYSQDIQQLETRSHMSWLPQEKLTTEEKETIQDYQRRKTALLGKYNTHIKDIEKAHETWIGNFTAQHKKRLQRCQELYATEEQKIDKTVYSTDELQAYAIYKPALDTYKETKDKATIKYNKELETLELEFDKVAKEINKNIKKANSANQHIPANSLLVQPAVAAFPGTSQPSQGSASLPRGQPAVSQGPASSLPVYQ